MELDNKIESQITELQSKIANRLEDLYLAEETHYTLCGIVESQDFEYATAKCIEMLMYSDTQKDTLAANALELRNSDIAQSLKDMPGLEAYTEDELKIMYLYEIAKHFKKEAMKYDARRAEEGYSPRMQSLSEAGDFELLDKIATIYPEYVREDMYERNATKGQFK